MRIKSNINLGALLGAEVGTDHTSFHSSKPSGLDNP